MDDQALDDNLEAEFDALMAIGHLTSRQEARLSAVLREWTELIERKKRRRAARKSKKRRKKKLPQTSYSCAARTRKPGHHHRRPLRLWHPVPVATFDSGYKFLQASDTCLGFLRAGGLRS